MSQQTSRKDDGLLRAIFEAINQAILIMNRDGDIKAANQHFCQDYAYQIHELVGSTVKKLIHPDCHQLFDGFITTAQINKHFQMNCQLLHNELGPTNVLLRATNLDIDNGNLIILAVNNSSRPESSFLYPNEEYFSRIFTLFPEAIAILDTIDGRYLNVNDRFVSMTGYGLEEIIGHTPIELNLWHDKKDQHILIKQLLESGEVHNFETRHRRRDGEIRHFRISARFMQSFKETYLVSVSTDVTDYKLAEEKIHQQNKQLQQAYEELSASFEQIEAYTAEIQESRQNLIKSEILYRAIFENTGTSCLIIDENARILLANQELIAWSGYSREELLGKLSFIDLVAEYDRPRLLDYHYRRRNTCDALPSQYEFSWLHKNGDIRQVLNTMTMIPGTQQSIASLIDITEQKRLEIELRTMATIDYLTGIYNRRTIMEIGNTEFERAKRYLQPLSVLMLDIDHFKMVNDRHGHAGGDQALCDMVNTCKESLRTHDILGRMGGEEFLVILPHTSVEETLIVANRLRQNISDTIINYAGSSFSITVSIGLSEIGILDSTIEMAINRADHALYKAKQNGRNRVELDLLSLI